MQPKIYPADPIEPRQIDKDALYVIAKLNHAGYTAYLVGGSVRDLLMGKVPKDFDIATSARPEEIKKLFGRCLLIGRRFRLAHIRFGRKVIEVSTFRSGDTSDAELILRDNVWGTPEEDVLRRDFTINGLFYDPTNHTVIDYVGGMQDLKQHLLRTIGSPPLRFKQDPVRMIRLLKFRARFGFHVEEETQRALEECKTEIQKSAPARVLEEFLKMLESGASFRFLELLEEEEFLKLLLPSLNHCKKNVYLHALDTIIQRDRYLLQDRSILLAALFFPLLEEKISSSSTYPEVMHHTQTLLSESLAYAFFPLPKKLRHLTHFILTTQFRLVLPSGKKPASYRIVKHPDYPLTLQFLYLRTLAEPHLQHIYESWKSHKPKKR